MQHIQFSKNKKYEANFVKNNIQQTNANFERLYNNKQNYLKEKKKKKHSQSLFVKDNQDQKRYYLC